MNKTVFPSTKNEILYGPFKMNHSQSTGPYEPVDCDFTDDLEFVSIKKILVEVKFWSINGGLQDSSGYVVDILTKNKEEFLVLSNTIQIRLDLIFQIRII